VASLSQGRTAAAQCGLFTHKSVPVIFEPPCTNHTFYYCVHSSSPLRATIMWVTSPKHHASIRCSLMLSSLLCPSLHSGAYLSTFRPNFLCISDLRFRASRPDHINWVEHYHDVCEFFIIFVLNIACLMTHSASVTTATGF